jgi:DnaJ-class molecular chaperone
MATEPTPQRNPGDEAVPGTPGTGEDVCPVCHGSGKLRVEGDTQPCSNCGGTGVIIEGIGGG